MPVILNEIVISDPFIQLTGEGGNDLLCLGARVREKLSTNTETRLEVVATVTDFDPKSILGKRINLKTLQGFKCSGLVISVEDVGLRNGIDVYAIELRPWLWLSTLAEDNRVFQNMTALEVIGKVFDKMGITAFESKVKGTPDQREYCVQYNETNFAFLSRLMEEEGIYYYFDYSGPTEKLILANDGSAHEDEGEIPFTQANILEKVRADADTIFEWSEVGKVVTGKVSIWDYDFKLPNASLLATKASTKVGSHSYNSIERYQSGAHYKTAEKGENFHAANVAEAHATGFARSRGLCNTEKVRTGVTFTLKYPDRPEFEGRYLVLSSTHYMRFDDKPEGTEMQRLNRAAERIEFPELMALYDAEFEVQPAPTPFRPHRETDWPEVPSLLTAIVTGPAGDEIHTDEFGRIKVQFYWDRLGKGDDTSSCWVRTVMPWTGKEWGFMAVPRIGMEVIIQFERGNIDRPICTGMVYNGVNKPPYPLPDQMNKMGWRTNSTKGGGGFHELTMDDTKGSENIFFQSEGELKQIVKNNAEITIGMEKKKDGNLTQTIYNNFTETVKMGDVTQIVEKGNRITKVKTDDTTTVEGKSATTITGDTSTEIKQGNLSEKVAMGNMATEVSMGNHDTQVKMGNITVKAALGMIQMEAMQSIELKVGQSSIKIDQMGVTINGAMMVSIEAKLMAELKSLMTTVKADAILMVNGKLTMIN